MPHVSIRFRSELYHIAPYDVHRQQDQENNKQGAEGTPLRETEERGGQHYIKYACGDESGRIIETPGHWIFLVHSKNFDKAHGKNQY
jgi:hypothetical protein